MNISFTSSNPLISFKMQIKSQPNFQKLSNFHKVSIFIAKMRRPMIPKLLFLKKKSWRSKNFEVLQYYNHGGFRQFEFSPSATPLFRFYRGRRRRRRDLCSVLFPCRCGGGFGGGEGGYRAEEALPEALDWSDENDGSIDRRAELFIHKFYEDRNLERLASV